ncbi:MAG: SDR family oxidoreductase [Candidatus Thorarchaeota archaeon]|nr:SDR family oxidoreductase [Candidatus Thorarchaeota archaeon]
MNLQLDDRNFLVTAASRGLGFGVAKVLVGENANVIICGRNEKSLQDATDSLGGKCQYFVADVSNSADVTALLDFTKEQTTKLDGLFVNAGGPPPGTFNEISDDDWVKAFNLTLMSAIRLTREAMPLLKKSDAPSILYSTSISVKQPIANLLLSNSLRPAVIGMMRTLSEEIGPEGIRINAVCPGYIYTKRVEQLLTDSKARGASADEEIIARIPLGRMGRPDEFGSVCAFLLSPIASYVHGALLLVDGGMFKGMM